MYQKKVPAKRKRLKNCLNGIPRAEVLLGVKLSPADIVAVDNIKYDPIAMAEVEKLFGRCKSVLPVIVRAGNVKEHLSSLIVTFAMNRD